MDAQETETVFVLDDDQGILESFEAMLGDDYALTILNDGVNALRLISELKPRLLFLDIKMPGISGIDILREISEQRLATKVVIVTALPQDHYEQMAQQYGVYRYLKKPLDVDEVEGITREVLH